MNFFTIKTKARRWLNKKLKFEHPSSAPFLSGDTFRSLANHTYDEFSDIDARLVLTGDIVFVKNNFLKEFFARVHPQIKHPYIVISHNDDTTIDESYVQYVDEKIIHWFGVNINVYHSKMTPLPIGLENLSYRRNGLLKYFWSDTKKDRERKNKIFMAFDITNTHPERISAFDILKKHPEVDSRADVTPRSTYIEEICTYNFIASPRGAGIDCHRTWEALYLGIIPIVKSCPNTDFFAQLGLPLFVLSEWERLNTIDRNKLAETVQSLASPLNSKHPALYINYWIDEINKKRKNQL